MMMDEAAKRLDDCTAWFGYCGDGRALAVDLRAGYEETDSKYVIVKWFRRPSPEEQRKLIEKIVAIGPF